MKKYLLSENGNFYKANLHCHTTVSDGKRTPEEIKEVYKNMGYSVVAFTDHNTFITHNDLTDDEFLALNGMELDIVDESKLARFKRTCHMCFIAKSREEAKQPYFRIGYELEKNEHGNRWACKTKSREDDEYTDCPYNPKLINEIARDVWAKGFFVTYNHPTWSRENYPDYINYTDVDAFEMFNGGSFVMGFDEYNPRVYDDMLKSGIRLYAIGADDNHSFNPLSSPKNDEGKAFTVLKAEKLDYDNIINSLVGGNFYCSQAPLIYELYYDDGKVYIKCSDAYRITITSDTRYVGAEYGEGDKPINEAVFKVPDYCNYFRLTVTDKQGRHACTNAYFLDDLK